MSLSVLMRQVLPPHHSPHQLGGAEDCSDLSSGPAEENQIHNNNGHNDENNNVDRGSLETSSPTS